MAHEEETVNKGLTVFYKAAGEDGKFSITL